MQYLRLAILSEIIMQLDTVPGSTQLRPSHFPTNCNSHASCWVSAHGPQQCRSRDSPCYWAMNCTMLTSQQLLQLASLLVLRFQRAVYGCGQGSEIHCQATARKEERHTDGKQQSANANSEQPGIRMWKGKMLRFPVLLTTQRNGSQCNTDNTCAALCLGQGYEVY